MDEDALTAQQLLNALVGRRLGQLGVGVGQVTLEFDGHHFIALEGAVEGGGRMATPQALDGLALLLPMLNEVVRDVSVEDGGGLLLTVGDVRLRCDALERYEAWNYSAPGGQLVVCLPGGGLSVWSNR